jgi:hypothetical protein
MKKIQIMLTGHYEVNYGDIQSYLQHFGECSQCWRTLSTLHVLVHGHNIRGN